MKRPAQFFSGATHRLAVVMAVVLLIFGLAFSVSAALCDDPSADLSWDYIAGIPTPGTSGGSAVLNGKLYTISGHDQRGAAFEAYDPPTNSWSELADYNGGPRYGVAAATTGGKLYAFAGAHAPGNTCFDTVNIYDPGSDSWSVGPVPYPKPVQALIAVTSAVNGKIYLFGGEHYLGWSNEWYADVYEFDPATGQFTEKASTFEPRRFAFGAEVDGKIYLFGGYSSAGVFFSIWIYDVASDSWSVSNATAGISAAAVGGVIDGNIYIVSGASREVYRYNPTADSIEVVMPPYSEPLTRASPFGGVVDGRLYVMSGSDAVTSTIVASSEMAIVCGFTDVEIDIKPWSDTNPINPFARGVIPVAILGSDTFDAESVDPTSLAFGPNEAAPMHGVGGHVQDVNDDGLMDLLSHYRTQETGIAMGHTEACVTGETFDGVPLGGCDMINTQPPGQCGIGFELLFLLPPLLWLRQRRRSCSA
jgi:N-acetylneuraminic acid mutarotase